MDPIETWHDAPEFERMDAKIKALEAKLSPLSSATPSYVKGLEEEVKRLRDALEQITANIFAFKPSCTHCIQTVRISAKALEASDGK